jgi:hypothetical protein
MSQRTGPTEQSTDGIGSSLDSFVDRYAGLRDTVIGTFVVACAQATLENLHASDCWPCVFQNAASTPEAFENQTFKHCYSN